MGVSTSKLQPEEVVTFRKLPNSIALDYIEIPERPENRKPTNVKWLVIFGVFLVVFIPFLIYTLYYSDIRRLNGYDQCGNICGVKNRVWDHISHECVGQDHSNNPYLQYDEDYHSSVPSYTQFPESLTARNCVPTCKNGYIAVMGVCYKSTSDDYTYPGYEVTKSKIDPDHIDIGVYLSEVKWPLTISCLLSILVAMGMIFLFRYAITFVVWGMLLGSIFGLILLSGALWYYQSNFPIHNDDRSPNNLNIIAWIVSISTVVLILMLIALRKKIRLVIWLFKEATSAIFDMPTLISIPVISVLSIILLGALFVYITLLMISAGRLQGIKSDYYQYVRDPMMMFSIGYHVVAFVWITQFITGIQYMVIAGAVCRWYFTREKNILISPILSSVMTTFKYHLGSIAFGSFLITIFGIIKQVICGIIKNERFRICVEFCMNAVDRLFKFLSKNSYIVTALHGQAFLRSGKRAAKLILQNVNDVIAINYIGDFVLGMTRVLIVIISVLLGFGVFHCFPNSFESSHFYSYIIIGVFAFLSALVSFGVFDTTIDTLFICYCEDKLLNNGMSKPYFMSRSFMEFMDVSKKVYTKKQRI